MLGELSNRMEDKNKNKEVGKIASMQKSKCQYQHPPPVSASYKASLKWSNVFVLKFMKSFNFNQSNK